MGLISGPVQIFLQQVGSALITLGQKTSANSLPVVLPSDQSSLVVWGTAQATGGASVYSSNAATLTNIKTSAGTVYWVHLSAGASYIQFFDALAANVTLGTTAPTWVIATSSTATGIYFPLGPGVAHATAISFAITTTRTGSTTTAPNVITVGYQ